MAYSVLMSELVDVPMHIIAPVIAQAAENLVLADVTRSLRCRTGFIARRLTYDDAKRVVDAVNSAGISCFVLDEVRMYYPPDYRLLNNAIIREDGFVVMDYLGNTEVYDWRNLFVISAGWILPHVQNRISVGDETNYGSDITISVNPYSLGPRISFRPRDRVPETKRKERLSHGRYALDLFFRSPQELHFRIHSDGFNYSCLGQKVSMTSLHNFSILTSEIVNHSPHAFGNRGVHAILSDGKETRVEYPDYRIYDEENLWFMQLACMNLGQQ